MSDFLLSDTVSNNPFPLFSGHKETESVLAEDYKLENMIRNRVAGTSWCHAKANSLSPSSCD